MPFLKIKNVDWNKFKTSTLRNIVYDINNILKDRENEKEEKERFEYEKNTYKILSKIAKDKSISIKKAYRLLEECEQYRKVTVNTDDYQYEVPCYNIHDNCLYQGDLDKFTGWAGDMYELLFTGDHLMLCEICYDNNMWIDDPEDHIDFEFIKEQYHQDNQR